MRETRPMQLVNSRAAVDRIYAETGRFQWAREAALNSIEARATRIHFGLDWNGVQATGTYRRFIADNGSGMTSDQLVEFFLSLGGSSKHVGGAHENYGIGAKVSLLPWNTAGLLVASWHHGTGHAIWAKADMDTGDYGLRIVDFDDDRVDVWPTNTDDPDPDLGFPLEALKPEWMHDHGTVLLLLGDDLAQHTILNDPRHDQPGGSRALDDYLNQRFWEIPDGVQMHADQVSGKDPSRWPRERTQRAEHGIQRRPVRGALREQIEAPLAEGLARGEFDLPDGTAHVRWYLRDPDAKATTGRDKTAFIAALYRGELYEHKTHHANYGQFGIGYGAIKANLWIVFEPRLAGQDRLSGVFPEQDRNGLLWNDGTGENRSLPWEDWAEAWLENMPAEVRAAIQAHGRGGTLDDPDYIERLAMMFGDRWRIERRRSDPEGDETVQPQAASRRSRKRPAERPASPRGDRPDEQGSDPGAEPAVDDKPRAALPEWVPGGPDDMDTGMIATYIPGPAPGKIVLNVEHPVICGQVEHWTKAYPHHAAEVRRIVHGVYGQCAVAAIAHSEQLRNEKVERRTIQERVRGSEALTLALMGLLAHDALISQRLAAEVPVRRRKESGAA